MDVCSEILAAQIASVVRSSRMDLSDEKRAQSDLESLLIRDGLSFVREHRLSGSEIVDFWFDGLALEIKIKANKKAIFKQLERYAKHDAVKALVLASCTSMGLPQEINGKPVYFIRLSQGWL